MPAARERAAAAARTAVEPAHGNGAGPTSSTAHEPTPTLKPIVTKGREKDPIPFGGPPGPLRLFHVGLGDQAGWMLPFALFGLLGVALLVVPASAGVTHRLPPAARSCWEAGSWWRPWC